MLGLDRYDPFLMTSGFFCFFFVLCLLSKSVIFKANLVFYEQ